MALMKDLSRAQLVFQIDGGGIDQFLVIRFRGTEGFSQLYRFEIDLAAAASNITLESVVGKSAVLTVNTETGERFFHGIIGRFEMTGETVDMTYFRAELVPAVWLLTHRYRSRIFQNKTVKEIIGKVLDDAGVPADRFDLSKLSGDHPQREYCVQYRETDFNFISRLMEEEGIFYFFEQSKDKHVLVMAEKNEDCAPIAGDTKLPYKPPTGLKAQQDHIWRFRIAQSVRPGAVSLNDFNFENPKLNLEAKANSGRDPGLDFADFPGEYTEQGRGNVLATIRAQEFDAGRVVGIGQSNCKRLAPGRRFDLSEHPSAPLNKNYLVTTVLHEGKESITRTTTGTNGHRQVLDARVHQSLIEARGSNIPQIAELAEALLQIAARLGSGDPTANRSLTQWIFHAGQVARDLPSAAIASGGNPLEWLALPNLIADVAGGSLVDFDAPVYQCRFECIPSSVHYRPPRITPWPVMRGAQTARVVGPEGEEIQVDKFGRVKVQFNWDLEGNEAGKPKLHGADSSCFIRVSQGWAGGQYGIMFIPRVGQEVVVDFLEGDPDQPLIVGRVFNGDHMPPYELPKEKTKSCIKTQSTKGGGGCNEIRFEDLKGKEQLLLQAQNQMDTNVKGSHNHTAGGSYHLLVGGEYKGELSGEYRQKVFKIKQTHVVGERRGWVEKDDGLEVDGARSEAFGQLSVTVSKDVVEDFQANHKHDVASTYACTAASIKIEAQQGIELVCGGSSIVIAPGGIWINGTMVYINSGAGAPVTPPSCVAGGPALVDDPGAAEATKPGKDTRYSGPSQQPGKLNIPEVPGHEFKATFIEIVMVDEEGNPVIGEPFDIVLPDGTLEHGITGQDGLARLELPQDGMCQVSFSNLDAAVWEKIS